MVLTEEGAKKYREELEAREISKIWDHVEDLQETYEKWCKEVEKVKKKHEQEREIKKKRSSKTSRKLMKEKKEVKRKLREGDEKAKEKLDTLKEQILNEENEGYYRRLKKTSEEISQNGKLNSGGFWKVKKRMERKKEEMPHAVRNKEGKLVTEHEEI